MTLIDGKSISAKVKEEIKSVASNLAAKGVEPALAVILVGEDAASKTYVASKEKACAACGIRSVAHRLSSDVSEAALLELIENLNEDESIDGILVQLPLPKHIDTNKILETISPQKDVDGFSAINVGKLTSGLSDGFVPCTPLGVMRLLEEYGVQIAGKNAVVLGRSNIVGKPMAMLLLERHATVTLCHSRTEHLAEITRSADILVAAVGQPHFVTADMVKPGATVIDVGINRIAPKKLVGDVDFEAVEKVAGAITPVPGGVGLLTVAMLMENVVQAAKTQTEEGGR
ncbi:bifunctional methylenetetrahydrofolate dehydrogenase/methenyltetrahydrofolate cyclohydrolase FolD [uncultured Campylobacter sp.]|uniref:bifunctional methylenetetrahydrofolate dehydrogenase/methenyltetrahydrofolate cyclohydrolase FolD n=1 Tax=uncultured Campylobacter sp. TaxID=218934 RepID=UPI00260C028C|nr:bifunctional methylenetetrahydrofolate dehydrogenase/methenyltetrahydrofolate cyclohydrolase FolD [uncultured Campylobacter sp.]